MPAADSSSENPILPSVFSHKPPADALILHVSTPLRWVPELRPKAPHVLRAEHVYHPVLLEDGARHPAALQTVGAQHPAAHEQGATDRPQDLHPQQEVPKPAQDYSAEGEVRSRCIFPLTFLLYALGCVWKNQNFGRPKEHHKFLQTGFEQQNSFNFSANTMCSVLLSLQLGIMLITPTIYKRFDIQLRFHWSELQRHTWWLGFTAQIFFTSQKSKLPCCEIKLCSVLKEYAKISSLFGRNPNAKNHRPKRFPSSWRQQLN